MTQTIKKIVATGDSIIQDLSTRIFIEAANQAGIQVSFSNNDISNPFIELVNTGMGGHTTQMIASRFHRDAVSLNPDIIVVNGGTNDVWGWDTPELWFESSWKHILDLCADNGIIAAALGIVPATGFYNDMMQKRDSLNNSLKNFVSGYEGFIFIDADPYVGTNRATGDPDNLWDIKPEYDMDGVHYTQSGSVKIAQAILESISHLL